jgi:hypothetical protein
MANVSDQTADLNGQQTHRITMLYGPPEFVKTAEHDQLCGDDTTPHALYADSTRRRFPCHTKAATWLSAAFFYENRASTPAPLAARIEARIKQSADYFGIGEQVAELATTIAEATTSDMAKLADDRFAIVLQQPDGSKERHYPLRNAQEVKAAADYLTKYRDQLAFSDRRQMADKILGAAAKYGSNISGQIGVLEKAAGIGTCAASDAAQMIRAHVSAAGRRCAADMRQALEKAAAMLVDDPASIQHFGTLSQIADVMDGFDRQYGLLVKYDKTLERPDDVLFAVSAKSAAELSNDLVGNSMTGAYYKRADLARVPLSDLAAALGDDFADAVGTAGAWPDTEKLAKIIPTLPRGDAELFDSVVAHAGIEPLAVESLTKASAVLAQHTKQRAKSRSLWARITR